MANPRVPKFGNWDAAGGDDVPYTQYFDKARAGRGRGKLINPNDPEQNPGAFPTHDEPEPQQHQRPELSALPRLNPGEGRGRAGRGNAGPEPPPFHPQPQNRGHNPGFAPVHPNPNAGRNTAAVPKFGEWDDPAAATSYTHIFEKVREERQGGATPSRTNAPTKTNNAGRGRKTDSVKFTCWGLFKK